jgi:DNA-binding PadR family transcriptional regulator
MSPSTLSHASTAVLQAVAHGYRHGFDVIGITGLPSGTVYPALRRLEEARFVTSAWENVKVAQDAQRPPRKYYEITATGRTALAAALDRYRLLSLNRLPVRRLRASKA